VSTHHLPLAGGVYVGYHQSDVAEATGIGVAGVVALIRVALSAPVATVS